MFGDVKAESGSEIERDNVGLRVNPWTALGSFWLASRGFSVRVRA